MDRAKINDQTPKLWAWVPAAMPGVAKLIKEKRIEVGDAHVNECWRRGVLGTESGWFYAAEGALAIGVPWDDAQINAFAAVRFTTKQALVIMRMPTKVASIVGGSQWPA